MIITPRVAVLLPLLALVACACWPRHAAGQGGAPPAAPSAGGFAGAAGDFDRRLADSIAELNALREQIAAEVLPLSRTLSELETRLADARARFQQSARLLDSRTLDLGNLRGELKSRGDEAGYVSNLLGEYIRNFETRLHIAELQRHAAALDQAKLALENSALATNEVFAAQTALVEESLGRLEALVGGVRFRGTAVDPDGLVAQGTFVLMGPAAIFSGDDGGRVGTAEQRLGSLEPSIVPFATPGDAEAARALAASGAGRFPLDPSLGNAHKVEATQETLWEHVQKGGPVMVPIFALAAAAFLVAVFKWLRMLFVRRPSRRSIDALLRAVAANDRDGAIRAAKAVRGPTGRMLQGGAEHLGEDRELIEEVMYETVLVTRLKLQRMLPFIAICAAAAPLLGLLGTVTGIINTFKLITVFGSGDVKTLSGGISQALITTEYGLIVAIPSLLLHALLSRKAKGIVDQMEIAAMNFVNQVSKSAFGKDTEVEAKPGAGAVESRLRRDLAAQAAGVAVGPASPAPQTPQPPAAGSTAGPGGGPSDAAPARKEPGAP